MIDFRAGIIATRCENWQTPIQTTPLLIQMSNIELPIFSDNLRSSASWVERLEQAQAVWSQARTAVESRIRSEQVEQIWSRSNGELDRAGVSAAAQLVSSWAAEPEAKLGVDRLLDLYRTLTGSPATAEVLRRTEPLPINAAHDPTPAILLPRMLDNAFDWFSTMSFAELRPVEQAAVVYLRLLDLYPFPAQNEATALLAASFYTERAGLPPLIIFTDETTAARFANALEVAFRMLTQPLVEFFAEMLTRTMKLATEAER